MGLDMYLYATKQESRSQHYAYPKNTRLKCEYPKEFEYAKEFAFVARKTSYEIAYWRKANAIHKYFVDLSGRDDDCRPIQISVSDLVKLVELCKEVLKNKNKASEILPTQDGFFFGSTEYDDMYFDDIEETIKMLEPAILAMKELGAEWHLEYEASW